MSEINPCPDCGSDKIASKQKCDGCWEPMSLTAKKNWYLSANRANRHPGKTKWDH